MQRIWQEEKGFGLIGATLIVAGILLIGVIGARLYLATASKNSDSPPQSSTSKTTSDSATAQPDTATYLHIKEMGIKIRLDDAIKDATYVALTLDDGSVVARFSTQSFAAADPACDANSGQLGALEKSTTDTDQLGNKLIPNGQTIFKLGDNYYRYMTSQALCSEAVRFKLDEPMSAMHNSLGSLQLDN